MAASKLVPKLGFLVGVILGGDGVFTYWRLATSLHLVPRVIGNDTHPYLNYFYHAWVGCVGLFFN